MRVSQAARALGISADTLKRYERLGRIRPARDRFGHRRYTDDDLDTVRRYLFERCTTTIAEGAAVRRFEAVRP
jgi:DNA-binding transcriptional MerR regulator